jgi:hypothetical protein
MLEQDNLLQENKMKKGFDIRPTDTSRLGFYERKFRLWSILHFNAKVPRCEKCGYLFCPREMLVYNTVEKKVIVKGMEFWELYDVCIEFIKYV